MNTRHFSFLLFCLSVLLAAKLCRASDVGPFCSGMVSASGVKDSAILELCGATKENFDGSRIQAARGVILVPSSFTYKLPSGDSLSLSSSGPPPDFAPSRTMIIRRIRSNESYAGVPYEVFENDSVGRMMSKCNVFGEVRDFEIEHRADWPSIEFTEVVIDNASIIVTRGPERLDFAIIDAFVNFNCSD